jgi:hypothetical protein
MTARHAELVEPAEWQSGSETRAKHHWFLSDQSGSNKRIGNWRKMSIKNVVRHPGQKQIPLCGTWIKVEHVGQRAV